MCFVFVSARLSARLRLWLVTSVSVSGVTVFLASPLTWLLLSAVHTVYCVLLRIPSSAFFLHAGMYICAGVCTQTSCYRTKPNSAARLARRISASMDRHRCRCVRVRVCMFVFVCVRVCVCGEWEWESGVYLHVPLVGFIVRHKSTINTETVQQIHPRR